jgi:hypothetical protein
VDEMEINVGSMAGVGLNLPNGEYIAVVDEVEFNPANEKTDDYITVWLKVINNKNDKLNGKLIMKNFSLSEKAKGFLKNFLQIAGFPQELLDKEGFSFDTDTLVGKEFIVTYKINDGAKYPAVEIVGKVKSNKQQKFNK